MRIRPHSNFRRAHRSSDLADMKTICFYFSILAASFLIAACTPKSSSTTSSPTLSENDLPARGKKVYGQNCTACHNPNPKLDGTIGPAIAGSSLELISARVLHANYPAGYKPKRDSHQMPALPSLEPEIPALHAFLNAN